MIPWGHHKVIMDKYQDNINKAIFFVRKTIANNWSRGMLENFVDTDLYERQGRAITNFHSALPQPHGDLAQEITKDPYTFDFVSIAEDMLFYNTKLHCYVVVEIKTRKFEASSLGQLGTYVAAVNHELRAATDNPT
ncbi:MAG: PDDEXK nuclease domain-containing protein, partial [Muribaculaceae bacterium]|nr:PDDEXK nuclease domain-containing protein [Muribaculaceae bacterium]